MKKSVFFDFFNRQSDTGFKVLLSDGRENIDYINWNDFLLPASYGDSQEEYQAIRNEEDVKGGEPIDTKKAHEIYTKVFEIAIVNASLSRDEFRVLAHLRDIFQIDDNEHHRIEEELREIVREKFEDPNVIDKMLGTLRDSVSLVGDLFDVVRKKAADGAKK